MGFPGPGVWAGVLWARPIIAWNTEHCIVVERFLHPIKDGASFCFCAYVLHILCLVQDIRFSLGICVLIQRYFCTVYDCVEKAESNNNTVNSEDFFQPQNANLPLRSLELIQPTVGLFQPQLGQNYPH